MQTKKQNSCLIDKTISSLSKLIRQKTIISFIVVLTSIYHTSFAQNYIQTFDDSTIIKPDYRNHLNIPEYNPALMPLNRQTSITGVWTELNPKVPRVDYLGIHFVNKDTGWACGANGTVIKTINGGEDWIIAQTSVTNILLKINSYNGLLVMATGYDGVIIRSTDGGENFVPVVSGVGSGIDLWGVQILNDTLGWVCGLNQTLLKTTDAGLTWQPINTGFSQHYWALDFLDEQNGMIACSNGKILKTTDGDINWSEYQAGDASALYSIDIIDTMHIVTAGANGKNVYSSDGGVTWIQNSRIQHDAINCIRFTNTDTGYIVGTYGGDSWGIRKTTNRGVTWFSPSIGNLSEWELEFLAYGVGYSAGSGLWIAKTTNGYDNWNGLFLNANFVDVFFTDELMGYAADGRWTGGPLYKTTDGGLTWFALPNFPSQVFTSSLSCVTFTDSLTGFAGSAPARIVKTTDAGDSWYIVNRTGLTDTIGLINKFFFLNSTTGWAITTRGGILKTTDAGENWFAQLNAGINVIFYGVHFVNSLYGWTANLSARPYKTTDGGNNWVQQTSLNIWGSRDIFFRDSLNGFIVNDIIELKRTTNSGTNWITQLNSQYVIRNMGWLSTSHGFIVGDGVYETVDSGNTWSEILEFRNVGLWKFQSPINHIGYSSGYLGLIYKYIDTTIVPVELYSFSANIDGNKVIVQWSTASELNNLGFEIQRCRKSEEKGQTSNNWELAGFVSGYGTTTEPQSYSFVDKNISLGKYQYRIKQIDFDGTYEYSNIIEISVRFPEHFSLSQNYPNPFNPSTQIKYSIKDAGLVQLKVYDILGKEVANLVNENKEAGQYSVNFDASNLPSGVYIYQITTPGFTQARKMILTK